MYDSKIKAISLIRRVAAECDISPDIQDEFCSIVINKVEQFLYTEILKEYVKTEFLYINVENDTIPFVSIAPKTGAANVEYDDIIKVFADGNELAKGGIISAHDFPEKDFFYTDYEGNLCLTLNDAPEKIIIIHRLRPILKNHDNVTDLSIAVPVEFVDMVEARVRGECYKIANEDGLAAKWLADYNTQLESFKMWADKKNERYGA